MDLILTCKDKKDRYLMFYDQSIAKGLIRAKQNVFSTTSENSDSRKGESSGYFLKAILIFRKVQRCTSTLIIHRAISTRSRKDPKLLSYSAASDCSGRGEGEVRKEEQQSNQTCQPLNRGENSILDN